MNLVERVKHILLTPRPEWEVIDAEPATTAGLYTGYIMPRRRSDRSASSSATR